MIACVLVTSVEHRTCSHRNYVGTVDMRMVSYVRRDGIGKAINCGSIIAGIVGVQDQVGFDHYDRLHIPIPQNAYYDPRRFRVRVIDQVQVHRRSWDGPYAT